MRLGSRCFLICGAGHCGIVAPVASVVCHVPLNKCRPAGSAIEIALDQTRRTSDITLCEQRTEVHRACNTQTAVSRSRVRLAERAARRSAVSYEVLCSASDDTYDRPIKWLRTYCRPQCQGRSAASSMNANPLRRATTSSTVRLNLATRI